MRKIETTVYSFSELSENAKKRAMDKFYSNGWEPAWGDENLSSLKEFYKLFDYLIKSGNRNWTDVRFIGDTDVLNLSGIRAMKYLWNNYGNDLFKGKYYYRNGKSRYSKVQRDNTSCVLTGFCMDDDVLQPIYEFLKKPDQRTIEDLLQECVESWRIASERDEEYQQSEEYFSEEAYANGWEFTEDGERV